MILRTLSAPEVNTPRTVKGSTTTAVVAAETAGPSGSRDNGLRVLILDHSDAMSGIDAVFSLIDGSEETVERTYHELAQAFGSSSSPTPLDPDQLIAHVQRVLVQVAELAAQIHEPVNVAIALWYRESIVLASIGESFLQVLSPRGPVQAEFQRQKAPANAMIRVGVAHIPSSVALILAGAEVVRFVRPPELRDLVRTSESIALAASAIAAMSARRGGRVASALIIQIGAPLPFIRRSKRLDTASQSRVSKALRVGSRVLFVAFLLFLLGLMVSRLIPAPGLSQTPTELRAQQVGHTTMLLSWRPVRKATGYIVRVASTTIRVRAPRIYISGLIRPGQSVAWRVRARLGQNLGDPSLASTLSMSPRPARHWRFPPSAKGVDSALLSLRNTRATVATVVVTITDRGGTTLHRAQISARGAVRIALPLTGSSRASPSFAVKANAPILAHLVLVTGGASHAVYGIPGIRRVGGTLPPPAVPHAFVIFMENKDPNQIIGQSDAPYINSLSRKYGYAANYYGVTHPSLPNYVASIAGDFSNAYNDWNGNRFDLRNLADQLEAHGMTWKAYMGGLPYPGYNGDQYPAGSLALYARKHNPFMMMSDIVRSPARRRNSVPESQLFLDLKSGKVPTLSFISPNLCEDMHGIDAPHSPCPAVDRQLVETGDSYLAKLIPQITASPAWKADSTIFIVWDEAEVSIKGCCGDPAGDGGGRVPAIVIARTGSRHLTSHMSYNHYSLLKTLQTVWKMGCLGSTCDNAGVKAMTEFLNRTP